MSKVGINVNFCWFSVHRYQYKKTLLVKRKPGAKCLLDYATPFLSLVSKLSCVMKTYFCGCELLMEKGKSRVCCLRGTARARPGWQEPHTCRAAPVASARCPRSWLSAPSCLPGFGSHHCSACHGSSGQLLAEVGRARSCGSASGKQLEGGSGCGCLSLPSLSSTESLGGPCAGQGPPLGVSLPPPASSARQGRRPTFQLDLAFIMRSCKIILVGQDFFFFNGPNEVGLEENRRYQNAPYTSFLD